MKKQVLKKLVIILISFFYICNIYNCFFCVSNASEDGNWIGIIDELDKSEDTTSASGKVQDVISAMAVIVRVVAVTVAIVVLAILAIKYMTAAPGEKADVKKSLIVYVVGVFVVFGAVGILYLIEMLAHAI